MRVHLSMCPRLQAWDDEMAPCLCTRARFICDVCGKTANFTGLCKEHRAQPVEVA